MIGVHGDNKLMVYLNNSIDASISVIEDLVRLGNHVNLEHHGRPLVLEAAA